MDRLTLWYDGFNGKCEHLKKSCPEDCALIEPCEGIQDIIERLAAYEDTGLTPEGAEACKVALMGKLIAEITEFEGIPIERMKEIAEAEQEGRLVVLPCKVGDTIYQKDHCGNIYEAIVQSVVVDNRRTIFITSGIGFDETSIGKTVFLTRAEAEKALEVQNGY